MDPPVLERQPQDVQPAADREVGQQPLTGGADAKPAPIGKGESGRLEEAPTVAPQRAPGDGEGEVYGEGGNTDILIPPDEEQQRAVAWSRAMLARRAFVAAATALATLTTLASVLLLMREAVVARLPDAARVYELIGVAPDRLGAGLDIRDVRSARKQVGGEDMLIVEGVVANIAGQRVSLPSLRVSLYDAADEELQSVIVPHAVESLEAGATIRFEASIRGSGSEARQLRVGFVAPAP